MTLPPEALEPLTEAAAGLGCDPAILAAILELESGHLRGDARLAARRFEPHVFRRLGGGLAASYAGAVKIDPELAEQASSHGAPQIMGHHAHMLDYASARAMRAAFLEGGWPEQIRALRLYAEKSGMTSALKALSMADVAEIYNGPAYARSGYHLKLAAAYARISGRAPARVLRLGHQGEDVLELQYALVGAGYTVDPDGVFGPRTEAAVRRYQAHKGLTADGIVGAVTWAALGRKETPEAVEPPPSRGEIELDRIARHRGKILAFFGTLAALREEAAAWADRFGVELGEVGRRLWVSAGEISAGQAALIGVALLLLLQLTPLARRLARRAP